MFKEKKEQKYCLNSVEFLERREFFKNNLGIDIISYFAQRDNEIFFDKRALYKDILSIVLNGYAGCTNLLPKDYDVNSVVSMVCNDDVESLSLLTFNRKQISEISQARNDEIKQWMQKNLQTLSDGIVVYKKNPDINKMAETIVYSGFLAITAETAYGMNATYGVLTPLAPVAMEGETIAAEVIADVMASLCTPAVVAGVITAAVAISVILISIAAIDRELSCLIINDTNYDIYIEDIYMKHGKLTAIVNEKKTGKMIPARQTNNLVYASFYTIEKNEPVKKSL